MYFFSTKPFSYLIIFKSFEFAFFFFPKISNVPIIFKLRLFVLFSIPTGGGHGGETAESTCTSLVIVSIHTCPLYSSDTIKVTGFNPA